MSFVRQFLCTVVVSYSCLTMGVTFAWPSSMLMLFSGENTTLHRPMTEAEQALFGSLSSIGALVATPAAGVLLDLKGRKFCIVLFSSMHVICWSMVIASNQVEVLLTALFVSGIGCGGYLVTPVYISDFCQESIRGQMTSGAVIFYALGTIISYIVGGYLDYYTMVYSCLSISVLGVMLAGLLKESPLFLMMKEREQEAEESLAFFRNMKPGSKGVLGELEAIRRGLNPELDDPDTSEEESKLKPTEKKNLSLWQFIMHFSVGFHKPNGAQSTLPIYSPINIFYCQAVGTLGTIFFGGPTNPVLTSGVDSFNCNIAKSYSTRRALFIAIVLMTLSIFQGLVVVQVYAEPLFSEAMPTMHATVSSIMLSLVTVIVGIVTACLTDIVGRKPLMLYASLASGVCCVLLGSQIHLRWAPHAVTAALIYLFCVVYTMGAGTVPYVMCPELFLPEVKSFAAMLVTEWVWLCSFVILFMFNPLVAAIGLGPVFYIFAIVCLSSAVFTHFFLPETKGLPVDEIQALFSRKRTGTFA